MRRAALFAALICCAPLIANAAAKREKQPEQSERVTAVKADGTVQLASSGAAVLTNILWPDAALAERWLAEHGLQQSLSFEPGSEDRYGRRQIESDAAEIALRDGAAILYVSEGPIPPSWAEAEAAARAAKRGVWSKDGFVINAAQADKHLAKLQVVEGAVARIYDAKAATYINFGEDWHTDFSITIPARHRRSFKSMIDTLKPGDRIRVRGFIYEENGPMITVTRPDNLEKL